MGWGWGASPVSFGGFGGFGAGQVRVGSPLASNRYTYDVRYADGDEEKGVARLRVRRVGEVEAAVLAAGQRVEARFRGGKQAFPGSSSGPTARRASGRKQTTPTTTKKEQQQPQEEEEEGGGGGAATRRWRPTAPTKLCMIEYDDGDKEASVPRHLVFARCVPHRPLPWRSVTPRLPRPPPWRRRKSGGGRRKPSRGRRRQRHGGRRGGGAGFGAALPYETAPDSSSSSSSNGDGAGDAGAAEKAIAAIFALFDRDDDGLWVLSDWDAHQTALGEESFTSQGGGMGDICGMLGVPPQETTGRRGRGEGKGEGEAATGPDALRRYYEIDDGNDAVADLEKLMPLMQKTIEFAAANAATAAASAAEETLHCCRPCECWRWGRRWRRGSAAGPSTSPARSSASSATASTSTSAPTAARRGPRTGQPCSRRSATTFASTTATRRRRKRPPGALGGGSHEEDPLRGRVRRGEVRWRPEALPGNGHEAQPGQGQHVPRHVRRRRHRKERQARVHHGRVVLASSY